MLENLLFTEAGAVPTILIYLKYHATRMWYRGGWVIGGWVIYERKSTGGLVVAATSSSDAE
jgi:hypothetical protein